MGLFDFLKKKKESPAASAKPSTPAKTAVKTDTPAPAAKPVPGWKPTNPRFYSNRPLSSLLRVFIFTDGDGKTVLKSPVAMGTLSDTIGAPAGELAGKVSIDVISRSNVGTAIARTGQFPQEGWTAMSAIDAQNTLLAQTGALRTCVRTFSDPTTSESGALVLYYNS